MIKKNEEYDVEIVDNGYTGEGIAKINDFTIFVPNVIKGEKVRIKILKVNSSYAFAKIIKIIKKSEIRIEEDCLTYSRCGGCNLRHIKYEETLKLKKEIVINNLRKQNLNIKVQDCIGMENPFYYRNKLQYPISRTSDGKIKMGVYRQRSHDIVETKHCKIQNKNSQKIANSILEFVSINNLSVYDEEKDEGNLRHIYIRAGIKTNQYMVVLVTKSGKIEKSQLLIEYLVKKFPEIKTIVINENAKKTNVILGEVNNVIYGEGFIYDELLGFRFKISPLSFYQVNPYQTEKLYSKAIEYAELSGNETILDLYCGIGSIGICSSKKAKMIYGIETIHEAINDAKINSRLNKIENSHFIVGDVENTLPRFLAENNIVPDCVFIDPPRKGCDISVLERLKELKPKKVVYVSCNPSTLARDLKTLNDCYDVIEITPFDMFSWTSHVECVAVLNLK